MATIAELFLQSRLHNYDAPLLPAPRTRCLFTFYYERVSPLFIRYPYMFYLPDVYMCRNPQIEEVRALQFLTSLKFNFIKISLRYLPNACIIDKICTPILRETLNI